MKLSRQAQQKIDLLFKAAQKPYLADAVLYKKELEKYIASLESEVKRASINAHFSAVKAAKLKRTQK